MALILTLLLIPLTFIFGVVLVRSNDQRQRDKNMRAYKLAFPADLEVERVVAWLHTISGSLRSRFPMLQGTPTIVFELWSTPAGFQYWLLVPWQYGGGQGEQADYIISQLRGMVPGINVAHDPDHPRRRWSKAVEIGMRVPTRQLSIGTPSDVSHSLLNALTSINENETIVVQWVVTPATRTHKPIHGEAPTHHRSLKNAVTGNVLANKDEVNDRRDKLDEPNMQAVLRIGATAPTSERAKHLIFNVKRSMSARASAGTSFTKRLASTEALQKRIDNAAAPFTFPMQLSLTELASLIAWPLGNPMVTGLPPVVARAIPPVDAVPRTGRILGMSNVPGRERPVAQSYIDARMHTWICASTGAGKTALLANMFKQDVDAGHGAFLMEAKGDLFKQALDYIPDHRQGDVIVVDLNNAHMAVGLNLLDQGNPDHMIDELSNIFEKMYQSGRGVWTRAVLYYGLKALTTTSSRYTLLDLGPLLSPQNDAEEAWSKALVAGLKDEAVKQWFDRFTQYPQAKREQMIQPVMDRIWELSRPKLKAVLGQSQSAFKFSDVVTQNKILMVNLSGVERDTANLMGALIFNSYWYAVRTNKPSEKSNFGYLDEFQSFVDVQTDFSDVLAKARSFGWGLTMANQYIKQLSPELQDAMMRNARTKVIFNSSGDEARKFANEFGPLVNDADLTHLGSYTAIARVASGGSVTAPFTLMTNPPATPYGNGAKIRGLSLAAYGRDSAEVEREMTERRTTEPRTAQSGGSDARFRFDNSW